MRKIDLGSIVLPVPEGSRPRLAFGPGDALLAVALLCPFGEVEVRAHAAPKGGRADLGGQWRSMLTELADQLRAAGLRLFFQDGPWGRELLAVGGGMFHRLVGREGDRWTLVAVSVGPDDSAALLADFVHTVLAEAEVRRGDEPQPAKELLPLRIVDPANLGEWERTDLALPGPGAPDGAEPDSVEPEPFRPRFPDPEAPGARGSAMQQLRALRP